MNAGRGTARMLRDVAVDVVAEQGRRCEASLDCADFLECMGFEADADAARMLRARAAGISENAFKTAAQWVSA